MRKLVDCIVCPGAIVGALLVAQVTFHSGAWAHDIYANWVNTENKGCCNNQDCRPLPDEHQRTRHGVLEIFVQGVGAAREQSAWCPVERHHYLRTGNAPDGSTAHSCVTGYYGGVTPCQQFVCYRPPALY